MINNNSIDSPVEEQVLAKTPILIAIRGPLSGRSFYLDKPLISMGRLSSNDIVIEDFLVSRHHCVIRSEGERYTIEDLNSSNGTYVNDRRVRLGSLNEVSIIEIGASQFLFRLEDSEESVSSEQNLLITKNVSNSYDAFSG